MHLFRIVRNGDFSIEENDDVETDFLDEVKQKLKTRRLGRVVRMEIEPGVSEWLLNLLKKRWEIDDYNVLTCAHLLDFTCLWQIIKHPEFAELAPAPPAPVPPLGLTQGQITEDILKQSKKEMSCCIILITTLNPFYNLS